MKRRGLAAGTCALMALALFLLWPDSRPAPAPGDGPDEAPDAAPAAFRHANWTPTASETPDEEETEEPREVRPPARLRGVEVALPAPEAAK